MNNVQLCPWRILYRMLACILLHIWPLAGIVTVNILQPYSSATCFRHFTSIYCRISRGKTLSVPHAQVNSKNLKERALWAAGWLQMADIRAAGGGNNGGEETTDSSNDSANSSSGGGGGGSSGSGSAAARPVCRGCTGTGWRSCVACNGSGRSSLIEL